MAVVAFESGISSVAAATVAAYAEFEANGTRRALLSELDVFANTAVAAGKTQLMRPGNTPTGGAVQTVPTLDPGDTVAAGSGWTTTWTAAPTAGNIFRQFDFPATAGSAAIFTWAQDRELKVGPTRANSLIVWNASGSTGPVLSLTAQWSE